MKINVSPTTVKRIGGKIKKVVNSWGEDIRLTDTHIVVARAFGHKDYNDMLQTWRNSEPTSKPDADIPADELAVRYEQYVRIISENDFSREEAVVLVRDITLGPWWGISEVGIASRALPDVGEAPVWEHVRPASFKVRFKDDRTVRELARHLESVGKMFGVALPRAKDAVAKMFGHDSFEHLVDDCDRLPLSTPDWGVSAAELGQRAGEYLRILVECGFDADQARRALKIVGREGWWKIYRADFHVVAGKRGAKTSVGPEARWRPSMAA